MIILNNFLSPEIVGEITRIRRNRFFGSERQRNQLKNIIKLIREPKMLMFLSPLINKYVVAFSRKGLHLIKLLTILKKIKKKPE